MKATGIRNVFAMLAVVGVASPLLAQVAPAQPRPAAEPVVVVASHPERDTLLKFARPLTVEFKDTRLEDAVKFMTEVTGADLETMWADDINSVGLNKDQLITFSAKNLNALKVMEKLLQKASEKGDLLENSWQMTDTGTMQIGPKERLNAFKRLEMYDINDLLLELPRYTDAPEFDLQSVLQNSGQGGGGQSPFRDSGGGTRNQQQQGKTRDQRAEDVVKVVTDIVEPEQWTDNGGTGGTIRYYQGALMVNAPDYIHRQVNGYPYWAAGTQVSQVKGRRWVSLNLDTAASQLEGLANQPVTAVVPGGGR